MKKIQANTDKADETAIVENQLAPTTWLTSLKPEVSTRPIPTWLVLVSVFFIFVAVFIKLWTPINVNRWPEAIYTLTFFYGLLKERHVLFKHPMVLGLFAALIATPMLFGINYLQNPERAVEYAHFEKLLRVYLFVPIAYWLSFNIRFAYLFVFLGFAGLVTACLLDPNLSNTLMNAFQGRRVDFNVLNAQHLANWSGLYLISWLAAVPMLKNRTLHAKLLLFIPIGLCLFGLYAAQTRALLIALFVCGSVWLGFWYSKNYRNLNKPMRVASISITFAVFTITAAIFLFTENGVKNRFEKELPVITAAFEGDLGNVPNTSVGIRIHSWATAIRWIAEKPIVGWGGDVREHVIDSVSVFNDRLKKQFGHLHNAYLEFWVAYGLIGFLIAFWPLAWSLKNLVRTEQSPITSLALFGSVQFLVVNSFESYLFFWPGAFTVGLFLAPLTSHSMHNFAIKYQKG